MIMGHSAQASIGGNPAMRISVIIASAYIIEGRKRGAHLVVLFADISSRRQPEARVQAKMARQYVTPSGPWSSSYLANFFSCPNELVFFIIPCHFPPPLLLSSAKSLISSKYAHASSASPNFDKSAMHSSMPSNPI